MEMESLVFWAALTLYVLATSFAIFGLVFDRDELIDFAIWTAGGALLVHGAAIGIRWVQVGHGPYVAQYEAMSSNAWVMAAAFLGAQLRFRRLRIVAPYVLSLVIVALGVAALSPRGAQDLPLTFQSYWLLIHIGFAKVANGALVLGAACAATFLYKDRRVSGGKAGELMERLPDLDWLDEFSYRFTALGFIFLALMIGAGSIWANKSWGSYWSWDPVETWSLVTWILYGVYLHLRRTFGWKGTRAAVLLLGCLVVAILSFFLISVIFTGLHKEFLVR